MGNVKISPLSLQKMLLWAFLWCAPSFAENGHLDVSLGNVDVSLLFLWKEPLLTFLSKIFLPNGNLGKIVGRNILESDPQVCERVHTGGTLVGVGVPEPIALTP